MAGWTRAPGSQKGGGHCIHVLSPLGYAYRSWASTLINNSNSSTALGVAATRALVLKTYETLELLRKLSRGLGNGQRKDAGWKCRTGMATMGPEIVAGRPQPPEQQNNVISILIIIANGRSQQSLSGRDLMTSELPFDAHSLGGGLLGQVLESPASDTRQSVIQLRFRCL